MDKKTWIILGALIIGFGALLGVSIWQGNANRVDYSKYDVHNVIAADENNGNFGDLIEGDPDAPVKIYEYGDYQCDACAPMNPYINKLVEEYDGLVAVVFRTIIMSYHQNGTAAAAAANAAHLQGYWKEYKDLLYSNQNDWFYSSATERQPQFEEYFMTASDGKGDLEKFRTDMASNDVMKKIDFDAAISERADVSFTPTFYVEDEFVGQRKEDNGGNSITTDQFMDKLRAAIDKRLEAQGIKKPEKKDEKKDEKKS